MVVKVCIGIIVRLPRISMMLIYHLLWALEALTSGVEIFSQLSPEQRPVVLYNL